METLFDLRAKQDSEMIDYRLVMKFIERAKAFLLNLVIKEKYFQLHI